MKTIILSALFLLITINSRATEKTVLTSDGVELFVKVEGKGTPVLYIHGGPGSGSYWFEEFFGNQLEEYFTVIYLDQRGVGRSSSPEDGNFSLARMAEDFEQVRTELGFDSWLTLGHSFGGILQMGYWELYPQAVKGMIMVNCTLNLKESFCESWGPKASEFLGNEEPFVCVKDPKYLMDKMNELGQKLREKDLFWMMAYKDKKNDSIMNTTFDDIQNYNFDYSSAALGIEDYWRNFKTKTSSVEQPVLVFYGTTDYMVGPDHYKSMDFPHTIVWKNEGGHIPFLENPDDLMKSILTYKKQYSF